MGGALLPFAAVERLTTWNACSDGVTVDLTPPLAARVLMGPDGAEGALFQTEPGELSVMWGKFVDIEEAVSPP